MLMITGGFIPKGPGINDEYFTVYTPSTPSVVAVPHLTTSMQLDVPKGKKKVIHLSLESDILQNLSTTVLLVLIET